MKSNAPGQLLGYALQFPRALYHLLCSGPGDVVCVEVVGDVGTLTPDGSVITEEDKSSTVGNPLTDKSTDLWKTFSNWIAAIKNGDLDVEKTKFILYCNQSGRRGLVDQFSDAQNRVEAQSAIDEAKTKLKGITFGHDIWGYYDYVFNKSESLLIDIIQRFELQIGKGAGYDKVACEVQRLHVPESQIDFLVQHLGGWLQRKITEKISANKQAIIRWDEFHQQFKVFFDRARKLELIDFTLDSPPKDVEIAEQVKIRPLYLVQLEKINTLDDELLEAVADYLRADVNRERWIENEIIDEDVASDFESRLKEFWKNQKKKLEITEKDLSEEKRGQLLLLECKSRQETIRGEHPPSSTIAGTYHALANEPELGWHPNWEKLFKK